MVSRNLNRQLLALCILLGATLLGNGCNDGDDAIFDSQNGVEKKPNLRPDVEGFTAAESSSGQTNFIDASYALNVVTRSGINLCKGEADIRIGSKDGAIDFDFPQAEVRCFNESIIINIKDLLQFADTGDKPNITSDGIALRIDKLGGATFNPPRPLLLGPIIQDTKKFKGYDESKTYAVSGTDPKTGQTYNGDGSIDLQVLGVGERFTSSKNKDLVFDNVIHWSMEATGFDGVPKASALLFDKLEMWFNARPIMVPKIVIKGDLLKSFISGGEEGGVGGIASDLIGDLEIILEVERYSE